MGRRVSIDGLADAVMQELDNYADTTTDGVKAAVKKAANTVKKRNRGGSPGTDRTLCKKLADQDHEGKRFRTGNHGVFPNTVYAGPSAGTWARHA